MLSSCAAASAALFDLAHAADDAVHESNINVSKLYHHQTPQKQLQLLWKQLWLCMLTQSGNTCVKSRQHEP
jgi:hypothetical protein